MKSFLNISDLEPTLFRSIITGSLKEVDINAKNIGCIYEKPSTRTRLSFNLAIREMGGNPIDIDFKTLNISRYESFVDTFRVFNCYLDGLIYRTESHSKLIRAKEYFNFPIINALSVYLTHVRLFLT